MFLASDVSYMITCNVVDDTNVKFSGHLGGDIHVDCTTTVCTVMHNVQRVIVVYDKKNSPGESRLPPKNFKPHQPSIILKGSSADDMFAGFLSWMLFCCCGVGERLRNLGLSSKAFARVKLCATVFMGDALKANDTLFAKMRSWIVFQNRSKSATEPKQVALHLRCLVHQLNLVRRPLALCFDSYWTTQVRLGHLWESCNFKSAFRDSMVSVIAEAFDYFLVNQLPDDLIAWRRRAVQTLGLLICTYHVVAMVLVDWCVFILV
jgi:hypothetical protein